MVHNPQVSTVQQEEKGNQDRKILDQYICEMNSKKIDITENIFVTAMFSAQLITA